MKIKGIKDEDFVNYKKPAMFISSSSCSFKCDKENGCQLCQNMALAFAPIKEISSENLIQRYLNNPISHAIVFGGLEPLDSFEEIINFIELLRVKYQCQDDVVIYTGYNYDEIVKYIAILCNYSNIIIKFGRFRPNQQKHFDEVLGVYLASNNQYAKKIS